MNVADVMAPLLAAGLGGNTPVHLKCWDGSEPGPPGAPLQLTITSPHALRRLLWAPNQLGFARAYVSGDLLVGGDSSAGRARVWRLYMAGCALSFEGNRIGVNQVLAVRPGVRGFSGMPRSQASFLAPEVSAPPVVASPVVVVAPYLVASDLVVAPAISPGVRG